MSVLHDVGDRAFVAFGGASHRLGRRDEEPDAGGEGETRSQTQGPPLGPVQPPGAPVHPAPARDGDARAPLGPVQPNLGFFFVQDPAEQAHPARPTHAAAHAALAQVVAAAHAAPRLGSQVPVDEQPIVVDDSDVRPPDDAYMARLLPHTQMECDAWTEYEVVQAVTRCTDIKTVVQGWTFQLRDDLRHGERAWACLKIERFVTDCTQWLDWIAEVELEPHKEGIIEFIVWCHSEFAILKERFMGFFEDALAAIWRPTGDEAETKKEDEDKKEAEEDDVDPNDESDDSESEDKESEPYNPMDEDGADEAQWLDAPEPPETLMPKAKAKKAVKPVGKRKANKRKAKRNTDKSKGSGKADSSKGSGKADSTKGNDKADNSNGSGKTDSSKGRVKATSKAKPAAKKRWRNLLAPSKPSSESSDGESSALEVIAKPKAKAKGKAKAKVTGSRLRIRGKNPESRKGD